MTRSSVLVVAFGCALLAFPAEAQYSDYDWAMGLAKHYGFDDLARKVLGDLANGPGRTPLERLQGKLGLAELRAAQARTAKTLDERLALYDGARQLIQAVKEEWADKTSAEYLRATFSLADVLQRRGDEAMKAVRERKADSAPLSDDAVQKLRQGAIADYARAGAELDRVRLAAKDVDPVAQRETWRLRNRAWYTLCLVRLDEALAAEGPQAQLALGDLADELDKFIIANETDDEEARLGAFYGYLLKGRVHQLRNEPGEAESHFRSVLDQISWEDRLAPAVQALVESAYGLLVALQVERGEWAKAIEAGAAMEKRFARLDLVYGAQGRLARAKVAEARLRQGDVNGALALTAEIVGDGRDDAASYEASGLVGEILAAMPEASELRPEVLRAAAKSAMSQPEKRADAVHWFQLLLRNLDRVADRAEREQLGAEAWYLIGSAHFAAERYLEAGLAFEQGARAYASVTKDDLGPNLVKYWDRSLDFAAQQTGSPEIRARLAACREWQLGAGGGATRPKGEILYAQARDAEQEGAALERGRRAAEARAAYGNAAKLYGEVVADAGPRKEQALVRGARVRMKLAGVVGKEAGEADARKLLSEARREFQDYLAFIADPANRVTGSEAEAARRTARAEARYGIADANEDLAKDAAEAPRVPDLMRESVSVLADFEKDHPEQRELVLFAVAARVRAHLALGEPGPAEADLAILRAADPTHALTGHAALLVGKAVKPAAQKALEAAAGTVKPSQPGWSEVVAKPEWAAVRKRWLEVCGHYRTWLSSARAATASDWDVVSAMYAQAAAWEQVHELVGTALEKMPAAGPGEGADLRARLLHRDLTASMMLGRAADARADSEAAAPYWSDAGQRASELLEHPRFGRDVSTVRNAAISFGGYAGKTLQGTIRWFPALAQHQRARELWERVDKSVRAGTGDDSAAQQWEADFYLLYLAWRLRLDAKQSTREVKDAYEQLKAVKPELGGPAWKPYFEWLERQL